MPKSTLKNSDIKPNDVGHVLETLSIFFFKDWSVLDVCVEGNLKINLSCLSPGGFEDCKYQSQQAMVLLKKKKNCPWVVHGVISRLIYRTASSLPMGKRAFY